MAAIASASGNGTVGCGFAVPRRASWADMEASDNESEDEIVAQDICREASVSESTETKPPSGSSSKELLHIFRELKLRGSSDADTEAGTSGRSDSGSEAVAEVAEVAEVRGLESTTSWEPNVAAPDFVPTQSMDCQLVGFCQVVCESAILFARKPEASPAGGCMNFRAAGMLGGNRGVHTGSPMASQSPSAIKLSPRQIASRSTRSFTEEAVPASSQAGIPEATEEDWERRTERRTLSVKIRKESPEYRLYFEKKLKKESEVDAPLAPDPTDRTISKRKWKYFLQQWSEGFKMCSCERE